MTEAEKALTKKEDAPITLKTMIEQSAKELAKALPDHMRPERLVRIALTSIRLNPELAKCTPESFLGALFTAAQVGLEPVAGQSYLIPFNNKRKVGDSWKTFKEVQFVMGYKGLATLFYRHEKAVQLTWGIRYENDDFNFRKGTDAFLHHVPALKDRGNKIGYYVVAKLQGGGEPFEFMTYEDCLEHGKKHSKTYNKKDGKFYDSSPWATNEDAMCLKTVLIQLAKLLPLSVELQRIIAADETSREYRKGIDDMLDIPSAADWSPDLGSEPQPESGSEQPEVKEKVTVVLEDLEHALKTADDSQQLLDIWNEAEPHLQGEEKVKMMRIRDRKEIDLKKKK